MQFQCDMVFAKTKIICHGARATRIGEKLIRQVWKYIQSTDFVKGSICENERKEMFDSISLKGLISYPDDIANLDTECDIIYQIILDDDSRLEEKLTLVAEKSKEIPCIAFVVGEKKDEITNSAYMNVEENELLDTFLDLFSVYTFPQEYGADFEELMSLFERGGEISGNKGEGFNLCVMRKEKSSDDFNIEIQEMEKERGHFVLASRIGTGKKIKYYSLKSGG